MEANDITDEEFAQYDRQIRLWGLDAQKRLRQAKVLIVGMGGLASEVVKNVVLAGVKAITLLDDKNVSERDMGSQLLVTASDIGKNRAEASKARTQELNPNVIVTADSTPIYNKKEHFFREFDIVCLMGVARDLRAKINLLCRMDRIKFFCGDVFGFYGYCFADLGMHEYIKEETKKKKEEGGKDGEEPEAKRPRGGDGDKKQEEEKVLVKVVEEYCSLEESFSEDWSKRSRRSLRQSSPVFFILQIVDRFWKMEKRHPTFEDKEVLLKLREELVKEAGVPDTFVPEDFAEHCVSELNPVCAITGGVLGQEIIKAASQRDATHNNYFFYDGLTHSGVVDLICPPFE